MIRKAKAILRAAGRKSFKQTLTQNCRGRGRRSKLPPLPFLYSIDKTVRAGINATPSFRPGGLHERRARHRRVAFLMSS
jgi:hypothetical protein